MMMRSPFDVERRASGDSIPSLFLYTTIMSLNNRKQEKDYSEQVKTLSTEAEQLAKVCKSVTHLAIADNQSGKLQDAIDKITALEKQTRNVGFPFLLLAHADV